MRDVAARYRDNLARYLIGIARDLRARVHEGLGERGHGGLRPSFAPLLAAARASGKPLNALATELGISGQAASQLVSAAEAAGYLTRQPHPVDGRSKLVVLTSRGERLIADGVDLVLEAARVYQGHVGAGAYHRFTGTLSTLLEGLGLPAPSDAVLAERGSRTVGVLPVIALHIERELMEAARVRGHGGLKMVFAQILPLIGPEGGRVQQIAREQRVSRQAVSVIVRELVALGYLERHASPGDGRGVVFVFSARGKALIRDSVAAFDAMEKRFAAVLGPRRLAELEHTSRELFAALQLEAEIFGPAKEGDRPDVEALASRLRDRLGPGAAERLAVLLARRAGGSAS